MGETEQTSGDTRSIDEITAAEARAEIESHIRRVRGVLNRVRALIHARARDHDSSKLEEPEFSIFASTPRIKPDSIEYGSAEYLARLRQMAPAIEHHYAVNRHHPEHFGELSVRGMNLVDVIEMLADWLVQDEDYGTTDAATWLDANQVRFGFGDELKAILMNTIEMLAEPETDRGHHGR